MTESEKVSKLSAMTGGTESRELISIYLEIAAGSILNKRFPYGTDITEVPKEYETIQLDVATYLINKRGAEGQITHKENGIDRTYESASIPESMLRDILPLVGVL